MRKAINENPLVQIALVGFLAVGVGVMLMMRMGGSSDSAEEAPPPATEAEAPAADAAPAGSASSAAVPPDATATPPAASGSGADAPSGTPSDFKPGPGLPKDVVAAYDSGKTVVLLVVDSDGIPDKKIKSMVEQLRGNPNTGVFVTPDKDIAKYSRITVGVDVSRTPALVVLQPKKLADGNMPMATVSYGFRGDRSVQTALDDAVYDGREDLPYYPN